MFEASHKKLGAPKSAKSAFIDLDTPVNKQQMAVALFAQFRGMRAELTQGINLHPSALVHHLAPNAI